MVATATAVQAPVSGCPGRRCAGRRLPVVASATPAGQAADSAPQGAAAASLQRRQLLSASLLVPTAAAVLAAGAPAALAEGDAPSSASSPFTYTDADDKFSITVPSGWEQGSGAIGDAGTLTSQQARFSNAAGLRRVVAFFPSGKPEVSVAITIQFIAPDFTKMGSLGTAMDFATGVVNKMDNSYILKLPEWRRAREGPVQVAKLQEAQDVDGRYVFSYTLAKEGEPERSVYQAVSIGWNGRYNRLYTVNATCTANDAAQYGPVLKQIVASFRAPAPTI